MFKISVPKLLRTWMAVLLMFAFALGAAMQVHAAGIAIDVNASVPDNCVNLPQSAGGPNDNGTSKNPRLCTPTPTNTPQSTATLTYTPTSHRLPRRTQRLRPARPPIPLPRRTQRLRPARPPIPLPQRIQRLRPIPRRLFRRQALRSITPVHSLSITMSRTISPIYLCRAYIAAFST